MPDKPGLGDIEQTRAASILKCSGLKYTVDFKWALEYTDPENDLKIDFECIKLFKKLLWGLL